MEKRNIKPTVKKIISGGQTGADMGGLLAAKALCLETGGCAPKDWKTEKGSNPELEKFGLEECQVGNYAHRTEVNVKESDGTIIFGDITSPGSKLTLRLCRKHHQPTLPISLNEPPHRLSELALRTARWIDHNKIKTLNVAGNRASKSRMIESKVLDFLMVALSLQLAIGEEGWFLTQDLFKDDCFPNKKKILDFFMEGKVWKCPICKETFHNEFEATYHCQSE